MSYEFFIARRYFKSKRKTGFISLITYISIGGVTIGVAALIIVLSIMNGFENEVRERFLGFDAHIRLQAFHNQGIKNYENLLAQVEKVEHVVAAVPYITDKAMIKVGKSTEGILIKGTDQNRIADVTDLVANIVYGDLDLSEKEVEYSRKPLPGIILGRQLADRLEAFELDQKIIVMSPKGVNLPFAMPSVKVFRLTGLFETGMFEFDNAVGLVSIEAAQKLTKMGNQVHGIEIKLDDMDEASAVSKNLNETLGYPYYTITWFEMHRNLFSWMKLEKLAMFVILSLIIMVAAFNIVSSLIMIVMEKTKEIGILKSMGATTKSVMKIFMIEGLVIGVGGTLMGGILGYLVCWSQLKYEFISLPSDIYFINFLPILMETTDFIFISVASIGLCFLATIYPALRASKLDPVLAIRYE